MNSKYKADLAIQKKIIQDKYSQQRELLIAEMNKRCSEVQFEKSQKEKERAELYQEKKSLGLFKTNEKKAIDAKIADINYRLCFEYSIEAIENEYKPRFEMLEKSEFEEIRSAEQILKEKYSIPTFAEYCMQSKE